MFVGIGGNTGAYAEVVEICRSRGLTLILDAAHMAGTRVDGVQVGQDADATVFSFQSVKNMPTADSGMICFADAEDDARARRLSWLGISKDTYARTGEGGTYAWRYDIDELGFKYNGNSIMAALAIVSLKYLDADNAERRRICDLYDAILAGSDKVERVPTAPGCESSRHLYQVLVDDRDRVMTELNQRGIFPGVHYRDNSDYAVYRPYASGTPRATAASTSLISLPLHLHLSDEDVEYVGSSLLDVVR